MAAEAPDGAPTMAQADDVQHMMECARYAEPDDVEVLRALLHESPQLAGTCDDSGRTLLHMAGANGHANVAAVVLAHKPTPNARNAEGNTALHYAATANAVDVARQLICSGWDVTAQNNLGRTPLQSIADRDFHDMEVLLMKHDESLESYRAEGATLNVDDPGAEVDEPDQSAGGNPPGPGSADVDLDDIE